MKWGRAGEGKQGRQPIRFLFECAVIETMKIYGAFTDSRHLLATIGVIRG
jgi:hypothetical protein